MVKIMLHFAYFSRFIGFLMAIADELKISV